MNTMVKNIYALVYIVKRLLITGLGSPPKNKIKQLLKSIINKEFCGNFYTEAPVVAVNFLH